MQLFRHKFPAGCEVRIITTPTGEVQVTVATARPVPHWLWGENASADDLKKKRDFSMTDSDLERAMLEFVKREPGRGLSYYAQLTPEAGGPRAGQQRRERALRELIQRGAVVSWKLEQPVRRTTHVLKPS